MIQITRLNDTVLYVNSDLIEFLESTPDTIITLTTGRKIVSKDGIEDIINRIIEYRRQFMTSLPEVKPR